MTKIVLMSVLAGLCFGAWPLVMKKSGLHPIVAALFLSLTTITTILPFATNISVYVSLTYTGILIAIGAGLLNGAGTIALQGLLADRAVVVSTAIFTVVLTQVVVTAVGGHYAYHDPFTAKKIMGMFVAGLAVYLLTTQ